MVLQEVERLQEELREARETGPQRPGEAAPGQRSSDGPAARRSRPKSAPMSSVARSPSLPLGGARVREHRAHQSDAAIGTTPQGRRVDASHDDAVPLPLARSARTPVPVLLVFALINRPDIFDLRKGNSFVEFLLERGLRRLPARLGRGRRRGRATSGSSTTSATRCPGPCARRARVGPGRGEPRSAGASAARCARCTARSSPAGPVRNLVLLTTPIDTDRLAVRELGGPRRLRRRLGGRRAAGASPGAGVDVVNKMMKPVTNYWTTYRRLWEQVLRRHGPARRLPADGEVGGRQPAVPGRARTASGSPGCTRRTGCRRARCGCAAARSTCATSSRTCSSSRPARTTSRRATGTLPLLDLVSSEDVTHLDRPGGHIGLMAGSKARNEIWPDIAEWLEGALAS